MTQNGNHFKAKLLMSCWSDMDVISAINQKPIKIINGREQLSGTEGFYKATSVDAASDAVKATATHGRACAFPRVETKMNFTDSS